MTGPLQLPASGIRGETPEPGAATFYIVRVALAEVGPWKHKPRRWYLTRDDGYPSHCSYWGGAERFAEPPTPEHIASYSGVPNWDIHADEPAEIYEIIETRSVRRL